MRGWGLVRGVVAFALAATLVAASVPSPAFAAAAASVPHAALPAPAASLPALTIVSDARYVVQPENRRVRVVVDLTATNRRSDTRTSTWTFDRGYLAVQPEASRFSLVRLGEDASSGTPRVTILRRTATATILSISFGRPLAARSSARFRLAFDLADRGAPATRTVRVGASLVTFSAWAFASENTPGSTVAVTFPSGYDVSILRGKFPVRASAADGGTILRTGALAKPLAFTGYLSAERAAGLVASRIKVKAGTSSLVVTLRRWPDDTAWAARVTDIVKRGIPALAADLGLPPPAKLTVIETTSRATGGYAGLFDPSTGTVRVAYDAAPATVLHEIAHAWLNGGLLTERWAVEGFAGLYAVRAAKALKLPASAPVLSTAATAAALPLAEWPALGAESPAVEEYGYAASYRLAAAVLKRTGAAGFRKVLAAAAEAAGTGLPPDGRQLLDLIEDRAGKDASDIWRRWVLPKDQLPLLAERRAARDSVAALARRAAPWRVPSALGDALAEWRFGEIPALVAQTSAVLDEAAKLREEASAADLSLPDAVRTAFEGPDGAAAAAAEIAAERGAIAAIVAARASKAGSGPPDLLAFVGGLGEDAPADASMAAAAFERGETAAALAGAEAALGGGDARQRGRDRVLLVLFLAVALGGALLLVGDRRRAGERRRVARGAVGRWPDDAAGAEAEGEGPYGTLADTPAPPATMRSYTGADTGDRST